MECNKSKRLTYTEKAQRIVNSLTLEDKISLMSGKIDFKEVREAIRKKTDQHYNYIPYPAGGLPDYHVPPMLFCDGPRGVVCGTGKSTCFPVSMLRGAAFDTDLEEKIGHAIGKEVLAYKGNLFAGICINVPYNPGWGRSQETYGEESFHIGEMGSALVRGVQKEGVIACVKHFAFNQMENSRFKVNIDCNKRTEREVFLPHFKKCIDEGAASIMSSYNLYKGTYCGHHDYLLNQVLKKEWGFDGFVMSDFVWGVRDTVEAANGGQDMEMCCTTYYGDKLVNAVKDEKVTEDKINEAALRIIRTLLAFDECSSKVSAGVIGCPEHIQLALQAAREGITLLKNEDETLPFDRNVIKKLLVLGKLGIKEVIGDRGSSEVYPQYIVTPMQGLINAAPETEVIYYGGMDLNRCKELAKSADAVVFVVGYDYNDEGEYVAEDQNDLYTGAVGGDRVASLGLHKEEIRLLQEVGPLNRNSAAVMIGGNMIMVEEWKDYVGAIIMAYYPGMEGGTAIGEIIFGDINPSGKLPYVVPIKESDLPQVNWDTEYQHYDYYHGYTKLEKEGIKPRYPFGFGLSYTTFKIDNLQIKSDFRNITMQCNVANTGKRHGAEVIQMYVGFQNSAVDRPVKILRGFKRVDLAAGENKTVEISCQVSELGWYNERKNQMEIEHMEYEIYVGNSSDNLISGKFILE
ncbi:glycosyl hydrolase [Anaerocolumna cellulosilytica]|uniref:Glycosyl hydrolase n=1 Tax=Anaerocolumna cellulosilytica TaxID=433286 RepID=A0A6S6R4M7_9FIRM|nr:glycoside hydrolase family 3 C-terminal domain-containing protein [Anaerocolumna cellulosilytica]MBB5196270.1 beta-glucosidase [Anaerocolumna cellulosilytica]BCJ96299.1 glycosyl hydrolase [Anaerocolumna cellulosilytica]